MTKDYKNINIILFNLVFVMLIAVLTSKVVLKNNEILIYLYTVAFILQFILLFIKIYTKKPLIDKYSFLLIGIYLLISLAPCICNLYINIDTNIYDYINIFFKIFYFFTYFCVFKNASITKSQLKKFMKYIIIIGIFACVYNFTFGFDEIRKLLIASSSYQVNIKSFFTNRNDFGGFIFLALTSLFYYYDDSKNKKNNLKKYLLIGVFLINITITFSRGAIFSTILLLFYMIYERYKNKKNVIFVIILLLITSLFLISNSNIINYIEKFIIRADNFDSNRFTLWKYGIKIIKLNPIFGVGYYTGLDIAIYNSFPNTQFHNFFIDTAVGNGIVGDLFIVMILFYCFNSCLKKCKYKYYKRIYFISFLILLAKMCIESISFFSIGYSDNIMTIYYITLPLLLGNINYKENDLNEK